MRASGYGLSALLLCSQVQAHELPHRSGAVEQGAGLPQVAPKDGQGRVYHAALMFGHAVAEGCRPIARPEDAGPSPAR